MEERLSSSYMEFWCALRAVAVKGNRRVDPESPKATTYQALEKS